MSRKPARCTQADIRRAIRAVKQEGAAMTVEILPDGTIRIVPAVGKPEGPVEPAREITL